uniref:Solute carrier family 66 member 3 n=1 Tax=Equus caballus TaxID=9796 RepID=A0A9L0TQ60_HORSE
VRPFLPLLRGRGRWEPGERRLWPSRGRGKRSRGRRAAGRGTSPGCSLSWENLHPATPSLRPLVPSGLSRSFAPGGSLTYIPKPTSTAFLGPRFLHLQNDGFLVFLRYQCYYEYPLLTYLEYPILILQDLILLLCIFHFNGDVRRAAPYIALLVTSWFLLTLQKWIIDVAINLCTFISAASKFAQLQDLWKTKDSGVMSALTCSLASYTCATRIITTLMTTNDLTILTRFVIMMTLNIWVTATVLRYQKTDVKAE